MASPECVVWHQLMLNHAPTVSYSSSPPIFCSKIAAADQELQRQVLRGCIGIPGGVLVLPPIPLQAMQAPYCHTTSGPVLDESVSVLHGYQDVSGMTHVGQFASHERPPQPNLVSIPSLARTESRELTYQKGRKLIQEVAEQLVINQHCIDTAFNFFKICVSRNFTRGRPRAYVVAACLYMTCRLENTSHFLLDFSDVTQVNVYELGRTINLLTRLLKVQLPISDPCLHVLRFAIVLDFGDKLKDVVTFATRIMMQRINQKWVSSRRASMGLCGAALVIASKTYGFCRTVHDVVKVMHISDSVLRQRFDEFASLPVREICIDEFSSSDLDYCEDPPAFQEARQKAKEEKRKREEQDAEAVDKEVTFIEQEIDDILRANFGESRFGNAVRSEVVREDRVQDLSTTTTGHEARPEMMEPYDYLENNYDNHSYDSCSSTQQPQYDVNSLQTLRTRPDSSSSYFSSSQEEEALASETYSFDQNGNSMMEVMQHFNGCEQLGDFASMASEGAIIDGFSNVNLEHCGDSNAFQGCEQSPLDEKQVKTDTDAISNESTLSTIIEQGLQDSHEATFDDSCYDNLINDAVGEDKGLELSVNADYDVHSELTDTLFDCMDRKYDADDYGSCLSTQQMSYDLTPQPLRTRPDSSSSYFSISQDEEVFINDDDFADIDDGEIDSYILTETEAKLKRNMWIRTNGPIRQRTDRKRKEESVEEVKKKENVNRKKRRITKKKEPAADSNTLCCSSS